MTAQNDYLYISTRIKLRMKDMLSGEDFARLASSVSDAEVQKLLTDRGYLPFDLDDDNALESALAARLGEVVSFLSDNAPDRSIIDMFRLKYDYHNIKVAIKAPERTDLLSDGGTINAEELLYAVTHREWKRLPEYMRKPVAAAADEVSYDAQRMDAMLDGAMAKQMLEIAENSKSEFLVGYVKLYIDTMNLKMAVRSARAGKTDSFILECVIGGSKPLSSDPSVLGALQESYRGTSLVSLAESAEAGGSLAPLDKGCDELLLSYALSGRNINYGESHIIAYLLGTEAETASVRLIVRSRRNPRSAAKMRERLRGLNV